MSQYSVASLWRYPVKSMLGEEVSTSDVTDRGLLGDRAYAVVDTTDGKAATAKNPRKWPTLFRFRAAYVEPPRPGRAMPPVRITLPDGSTTTSVQSNVAQVLSAVLNRKVTLNALGPEQAASVSEEYWPDIDGRDFRNTVTDFTLPDGTFFDAAMVHVLTTATLEKFHQLYPQGRFEISRFRPNIVVQPGSEHGFVENNWSGRSLVVGDSVRLNITGPCGRCVMTTLAQGDLPADPGILRTAVRENNASVGMYAKVVRGGTIRRGDLVRVE
jgi:uncharacterized protein YcbX